MRSALVGCSSRRDRGDRNSGPCGPAVATGCVAVEKDDWLGEGKGKERITGKLLGKGEKKKHRGARDFTKLTHPYS